MLRIKDMILYILGSQERFFSCQFANLDSAISGGKVEAAGVAWRFGRKLNKR